MRLELIGRAQIDRSLDVDGQQVKGATVVPRGTFYISIDELRRQVHQSRVEAGPDGLRREQRGGGATKVPKGTFHISIDELRRQVRQGRTEAGPDGLRREEPGRGATKVPKGTFHDSVDRQRRNVHRGRLEAAPDGLCSRLAETRATTVPKGTFSMFESLFGQDLDPIAQFERDAPYASYSGNQNGEDIWMETVSDPVTGISVTLAYTTSDAGRTAEAYCIDPDMRGHTLGVHNVHCYEDGRLCTDQHGIRRNLPKKRARALLWVTGFASYLREGRFAVDVT